MLSRWFRARSKSKVDLSFVDPNFLRKTYEGGDWSGHRFGHFVPVSCTFRSCTFEACNFVQACFGGGLEDSYYTNCTFDRSYIRARAPGNARFESCSFLNVEIVELFGHSIEMINCRFSGVIRKAFFNGEVLAHTAADLGRASNEFEGNDFSKAQLVDVSFRTGIDLCRQRLPTGWRNEA
jgi:uncharacterized protein YjbI with pentapeptide repeats